jgi:hypothetical protein
MRSRRCSSSCVCILHGGYLIQVLSYSVQKREISTEVVTLDDVSSPGGARVRAGHWLRPLLLQSQERIIQKRSDTQKDF